MNYKFINWEEYINTNGNILSENKDCIPKIHNNTFIYSSVVIENEKRFIIKGDWSDKSKSLTPTFNINCHAILVNWTIKDYAFCIYNSTKKTEFNCSYDGTDSPAFEDQLISGSDRYIYKLEKNGISYISLNISILLLLLNLLVL